MHWLQIPSSAEELSTSGDKLAQLQSNKAEELMHGFERTTTEYDWKGVIDLFPVSLRAVAHELALDLLLNGAGSFHRRIQKPLRRISFVL